ncbi:MAG: hypothetical protein GY701_11045 [Sulfitobacter sp.]|nr:hypothetical protein [Sulfitobacter sp.]
MTTTPTSEISRPPNPEDPPHEATTRAARHKPGDHQQWGEKKDAGEHTAAIFARLELPTGP